MTDFEILEVIRAEIQAEHTLISHRLGWYVGSISLLMTAFAIALGASHSRPRFFSNGMPLLGILLSFLACCAIWPAVWVQADLLQTQREAIESARARLSTQGVKGVDELARLNDYARVTCGNRQSGVITHWTAMSAPVLIPVVFLIAWVFCFWPGLRQWLGRFWHSRTPHQSLPSLSVVATPEGSEDTSKHYLYHDTISPIRLTQQATLVAISECPRRFHHKYI